MTNQMDYITPTKERPVFKADCDYFGYIDDGMYKDALVGDCCTSVFALSYVEAVQKLHDLILEDDKQIVKDFPKAKFNIYAVDGSLDKMGDGVYKRIYTVTPAMIKKYF